MRKITSICAGVALMAGLVFTSCSKEGCTDNKADNYCSDCKKDDGSCTYTGKMVIWWGKTLSDSANAAGITALKLYVNGAFINTYATSTYWTGAPNCGSNGSISYSKSLGSNSSGSVSVELKDQNNTSLVTNSVTLTGNTCLQYEIPW